MAPWNAPYAGFFNLAHEAHIGTTIQKNNQWREHIMSYYRRIWNPGGTYFFTINLLNRYNNDLLIRHIDKLRQAIIWVKAKYPFTIHAWVVLPEHMHCVIELPEDDIDYALRLRLIKTAFSKTIPAQERRLSHSRQKRQERGIWQRRYWEHMIRNEHDYRAHMDYVHINPVKHGLVKQVSDWPYSTFHRLVEQGVYEKNWGGGNEQILSYKD